MKTSSAKSKGRRACQDIKQLLHNHAPELQDGDVGVTPSGVIGVDLYLSPAALKTYPFCIESKNQESLSIWACLEQTESHRKDNLIPILFFKRNRSELYACLKAEEFVKLYRNQEQLDKLNKAKEIIHEEFCGSECHAFCLALK